jgi:hypothetical protein
VSWSHIMSSQNLTDTLQRKITKDKRNLRGATLNLGTWSHYVRLQKWWPADQLFSTWWISKRREVLPLRDGVASWLNTVTVFYDTHQISSALHL